MQVGQYGGEVASAFDGGSGGDPEVYPHFGGNDVGEGRLSQSWWPVKQYMVKCLTSPFGRGDGNAQVIFDFFLPDELIEATRPETGVEGGIFSTGLT